MKLPRHTSKRGRVEIIPFIDTVLILLIFYMSFSTITGKEKRIDIQQAHSGHESVPPVQVVLHVFSDNEISANGVLYTPDSLRDVMQVVADARVPVAIIVEADPTTKYHDIMNALDACAQAKLTSIAFRQLDS